MNFRLKFVRIKKREENEFPTLTEKFDVSSVRYFISPKAKTFRHYKNGINFSKKCLCLLLF